MNLVRFEQYLETRQVKINELLFNGRREPDVLALLLTESFLRPERERAVEYLAWVWSSYAAKVRAKTLSVGPGQIQLRHWKEFCGWPDIGFSIARWRTVSSWSESYDVAFELTADCTSLREKVAVYRGEVRTYYLFLAERAKEHVQAVAGTPVNTRLAPARPATAPEHPARMPRSW